jgi:hypothetical protein
MVVKWEFVVVVVLVLLKYTMFGMGMHDEVGFGFLEFSLLANWVRAALAVSKADG